MENLQSVNEQGGINQLSRYAIEDRR